MRFEVPRAESRIDHRARPSTSGSASEPSSAWRSSVRSWIWPAIADPSLETLARLSGRGRRSGIGLHGFFHGGLIVDGGRRDEAIPPRWWLASPSPRNGRS